ncbi:Uncharacterised protein [Serratia marcescens]|uniref:DUF4145 domain-containing protein n=1 Tax=Serratia marcescens TaxID=615 RepID=UPI0009A54BAB|nr:DUF4145 domain-containing protein [Serratia marcescens]MBH3126141.1 DUF4145 domain-containing protein [Serratia marcescens]CAB5630476.1 Uncharacterised protein [Serratia marcescens]CAB5638107.1 Uncharacterised protein [Serratia marcescens]
MAGPFKFKYFTKNSIPDWCCPACGKPTLVLIPEYFHTQTTSSARHQYEVDPGFCPEDDEEVFSCLLRCSQRSCLQPVSVSGVGYYEREYENSYGLEYNYIAIYYPKYFYPPLTLFTHCESYPEKIKSQLKEISAQLPGHRQAAINALRTTLEIVLDYFEVPREAKNRYLSLDKRISLIPAPYKYVESGFRAMKWLGNTGSHNLKEVLDEDIEGACLMLDDFLLRIFSKPTDHSETISQLNKNYAPQMRNEKQ